MGLVVVGGREHDSAEEAHTPDEGDGAELRAAGGVVGVGEAALRALRRARLRLRRRAAVCADERKAFFGPRDHCGARGERPGVGFRGCAAVGGGG